MALIPLYDCELVDLRTSERLLTVTLPLVPRVGEEVRAEGNTFRVAKVAYDLDGHQRVRLGHLSRVVVYLELAV